MDYRFEQWINHPAGHTPWLDTLAKTLAVWSEPVFIAIIAIWFLFGWWRGRPSDRQGAITALIAAGIGLALNQVLVRVWERPRPFVAHPQSVHLLVRHGADASFPSDHAISAFAIAVTLACFHWRTGIAAILLAAAISIARVYIGVHYPADIAAGALLGTVVALVLTLVLGSWMTRLREFGDSVVLRLHLPLPA